MSETFLVSCGRRKRPDRSVAKELYCSARFASAKQVAERYATKWWILSARHGLVDPLEVLEPYDQPIDTLSPAELHRWAQGIIASLHEQLPKGERITILADDQYASPLLLPLQTLGHPVRHPLRGRNEQHSLEWFEAVLGTSRRASDLQQFYGSLARLRDAGRIKQPFSACEGSDSPLRGVYFFFEPGQTRFTDHQVPRVVRVGTHAVSANSKSTLWTRLRTHRGTGVGGGSHRSSIMRLHIGAAMISRGDITVPTWAHDQSASASIRQSEAVLEARVSAYIGKMDMLWLNIGDEPSARSDRAYIEQNSIALLAGRSGAIDIADSSWLGTHSPVDAIRRSFLWNIDYVDGDYDPLFLPILDRYVSVTLGMAKPPSKSLAPPHWQQRAGINQLVLFGGEFEAH